MDSYEIYGLCQNEGVLDYVVALDINSNEIRVVRFTTDASDTSTLQIKDYTKVDKDDANIKIVNGVFVDCAYQGDFNGQNIYTIAIGGTYFNYLGIQNYYLAKFSTKYNFTEFMITSPNYQVMETVAAVSVDAANQMIYIALEINKQSYLNRTVYQPGDQPGNDNANVAIHGYSWFHGVRLWTNVIGDPTYTDQFARMKPFGNYLYVFLNSYSTVYTNDPTQTDIYYYRIRASNGYIQGSQIFGSPTADFLLDLEITFRGLYLLALVSNGLLPHRNNNMQWQTQSLTENIAVIWMDFLDNIIDIEGYALAKTVTPYPMKLLVPRTTQDKQTYVFVSPRTNNLIDVHGGFYLTYFTSTTNLFGQYANCMFGCAQCSSQVTTICMSCLPGYYLFQGQCIQNTCPDYSYYLVDPSGNQIQACQECHYSCRNCNGPRSDQCSQCCVDNLCGPILNRVPNLGTCSCPAGLIDSNGICVQRCVLNLAGRRNEMCYPQCPDNSYPLLRYDQATAQERSQYDATSQTDCPQSPYQMKFTTAGKGLAVPGPPDMNQVPSQFTIGVWVMPTALNPYSYVVNAFNRIQVRMQSSTYKVTFLYQTSSSTYVEPTYTNDYRQKVVLSSWNYIMVSLRTINVNNILMYEQQLAISNSNTGALNNAGYSNSNPYIYYSLFKNTIYLGSYSDINPQSFSGYLKEFKLFTTFHSYGQMQDEMLRLYRYYSYDDPNLVAYWKLSEAYSSNQVSYVVYDYSKSQRSLTYSIQSDSNYPTYVYDQSYALSLCIYHDVKVCVSPDYSQNTPYVIGGGRLTRPPTFNLQNTWSLTFGQGDQIWIVPNNTLCTQSNILASMTYIAFNTNAWAVPNSALSPVLLPEGIRYQVCYFDASLGTGFNLYQTYLIAQPITIDPSTSNGFMADGVSRTFMTSGGDQSFMDVIKFSLDCSQPKSTDYEMFRNNDHTFGEQFLSNFSEAGDYYLCWQHTYVQETLQPYFQAANDLRFRVIGVPTISSASTTLVAVNQDMVVYNFTGAFADGDQIAFSWAGIPISDCNPSNLFGNTFVRSYESFPGIWFGQSTGIFGVTNYTNDVLHMCYLSQANDAPNSWARVRKDNGETYSVQVTQYNPTLYPQNQKCPELISFDPSYGSSELTSADNTIKFNFESQAVYPARVSDVGPIYGQIIIYRGALLPDGTVVKTNQILWSNTHLDDLQTPNPFTQGDLQCSGQGSCSIILSNPSNQMKGGELYFLSFYMNSFANKPSASSTTRYYLFNTKTLDTSDGQTTPYDHYFICRSFTIQNNTNMINGRTLVIQGTNLQSITIKAKETSGTVSNALFTTKAINLALIVINTASTYCVTTNPVATVRMQDVTQTQFTISNLELRECSEGTLMAEVELVRGIQDQYGEFTHIKKEVQKYLMLGVIGCDPSCLFCNGTTYQDCIVCKDQTNFLYQGVCYTTCPSNVSAVQGIETIVQNTLFTVLQCVPECPYQYYPDAQTNICLPCNSECQNCNSSDSSSCSSCVPISYLFNGMCLDNCPSPHHQNNFTSYECDEISEAIGLSVQIQKLGYRKGIPKNVQQYLKAAIFNTGGGFILSVQWTQLDPPPTSDDIMIFSKNSNGQILNNMAVVQLKMTAFNSMSTSQAIKVQCTVINSFNQIAYDIIEFYQNAPPTAGNMTITYVSGPLGKGNGTTVDSIYEAELDDNWYDYLEVGEPGPEYRLYMLVDGVYYTLSDQTNNTNIQFRIPLYSTSETIKNVSICVVAVDYWEATTTLCEALWNVVNQLNYVSSQVSLLQLLQSLDYQDMNNVLFASQMLFTSAQAPKRDPWEPGLCSLDYHCNMNGLCSEATGLQRCLCNQGYSGSFCQYVGSQLYEFQAVVQQLLDAIITQVNSRFELRAQDIENVGVVLRGILRDPDLLPSGSFQQVLQLIETIGGAGIYAHYPVTTNVRTIYLDALSAGMNFIFHSYATNRAYPKTSLLAVGQSLIAQNQYDLSSERRMLQSQPTYLIGGFSSLLANNASNFLPSNQGTIFTQWARILDEAITNYTDMTVMTLDLSTTSYTYTSNAIDFMGQAGYSPAFEGQQIFIQEKDAYWNIPSDIFVNSQSQASDQQFIYLKTMKYLTNPFIFEPFPGAFVETNVTEVTFYDTIGGHIAIDLSNASSYISIKEAYNKTQGYPEELRRCMAWNDDTHTFMNDNSCSAYIIVDQVPCLSCDDNSPIIGNVSSCRCSHLSRFAMVFEQTSVQAGPGNHVGLYSDFFAMNYWMGSFGFFAVLAGFGTYIAGLFIMIIWDRNKYGPIIARLRERMQNLEKKGFIQLDRKKKKLTVYRDLDGKVQFIRHDTPEGEKTKVEDLQATKKGKDKGPGEKMKNDNDAVEETDLNKVKAKGKGKGQSKNKVKIHELDIEEEEKIPDELDGTRQNLNTKADKSKDPDGLNGTEAGEESKMDSDLFEQIMQKRYQQEKEEVEFVKMHGTESDEENMEEKYRNKDQKKYLQIEKKAKEVFFYHWKNMLIHGNYLTSLLYIDSILSPRHARWTLLFTCVLLNWFWCAVIYNNTKDPLALPDVVSQYVFTFIEQEGEILGQSGHVDQYSVSTWNDNPDVRIRSVQLKKEMRLRFFIAYCITIAIHGAVYYYIIRFSASFGWQVSWSWFYQGLFAVFFQIAIIDNVVSIVHWVTYYCSRQLAIFWMQVRILKQAKMEA